MPISAHFEHIEDDGVAAGRAQPRAGRRRLLLEAEGALPSGDALRVTVHNLSETGLLMQTAEGLDVGETIDLVLPEAEDARARVVWASGELYGCAFESPLPPATLSAAQLRSSLENLGRLGPAPAPPPPAAIGGETLGERLHRLRKLRGFTQSELAARLGVSKPTVWAWEQGRARPIEERLDAIAETLGVTSAELRPPRATPGLAELVARCREQIAAAVETSPDKIRILIEL